MIHEVLEKHHEGYKPNNHVFAIYVPSTLDVNKPLSPAVHKAVADEVAKMFSSRFGGATVHDASGHWVDEHGNLVSEPVKVVLSSARIDNHGDALEHLLHVKGIASALARIMGQSSVLVEHHGPEGKRHIFVDQDYPLKHGMFEFHRLFSDGEHADGLHNHLPNFIRILKATRGLKDSKAVLDKSREIFDAHRNSMDNEKLTNIRTDLGVDVTKIASTKVS